MFVKPGKRPDDPEQTLLVRYPGNPRRVLAATGAHVPDGDVNWTRLLSQGDVVLAEPPAEPEAAEPTDPAPAGGTPAATVTHEEQSR